ncbi:hypothetical protein EJ05DRAFT_471831 [Pseudovirgaria hyperparasitica]|uniref:Uncharacterized protein n=1 Tax=Pseudovirgaria hyperparasitica TaxID=470096 RepID=A0A6A6WLI8_9PEZI|nr:uncharacterized protein EJ05DRAFT_471831 [Pseudovirgaria hyperparasitica]KAF2762869.1 hypothetical protein EJ05DRAFT_471831 [Pseudovirgaria hyperparasitica]
MKLHTSILLLAASTLSTALAIEARAAQDVLNDISQIKTQTATVQRDIDAFQGGPASAVQALQIKTDSDTLQKTIQKGSTDARNSASFTDNESAAIANAVTGLQTSIFKVLNSLVAKKAGFETAIFGSSAVPIVHDTLVGLRADTGYFGGNVTQKLTPQIAKLSPLIVSNIDFHFVRAVDAFSSG